VDKTRTKEEKEIYNMMKVYARFNSPETHDRLVQDIIKEKQMRQRLEELKEMKRRGVRTLGEIEDELMGRKRKDDRGKKKESDGASISDKVLPGIVRPAA
jgi:transcriptional adapter 2-alpha